MNKFEIRYEGGYYYTEEWKAIPEMFCPHCGTKKIFTENNTDGDYYEGVQYICISCGFLFTMPTQNINNSNNWQVIQRLEFLRFKGENLANHYHCPKCLAYGISLDDKPNCSHCGTKIPTYRRGG